MSDPGQLPTIDRVPVLDVLVPERRLFCELLESLDESGWARPTECPAWTVKGIALHVLGDDLSLLSRQRDAELPGLLTEPSLPSWADAPPALLDQFNERWVHASTFLSPALVVELLGIMGEQTHDWYASVDPESLGEAVLLFGPGPAPYWAVAAREYLERWVHHLQIRRALGLEPGAIGEPPFGPRAWEMVVLALRQLFRSSCPRVNRRSSSRSASGHGPTAAATAERGMSTADTTTTRGSSCRSKLTSSTRCCRGVSRAIR